jgi:outer membrane protein
MRLPERTITITWIFLCVTAIVLAAGTGFAQNLKIAVVDLNKVYKESVRVKNLSDEINQIRSEASPKIAALTGDLKKIDDQLSKGKDSLKPEEKDKLENDRKNKLEELQNEQQSITVKISFKQKSLQNVFRSQLNQVIEKVAKDEGLNLVLLREAVLFSQGTTDVSDKIAKALDAMPALEQEPK